MEDIAVEILETFVLSIKIIFQVNLLFGGCLQDLNLIISVYRISVNNLLQQVKIFKRKEKKEQNPQLIS